MSIEDSIRDLAAERKLPRPSLDAWLAMDSPSREALLQIALDLRLRTGQIAQSIELLGEIAVRERISIDAVLARDDVRRAASGAGSGPAHAAAFLATLRAIRFPRLARASARLNADVAALRLPRGISLVLPKDLGSDELMIRISARNGAELKKLLGALRGCEDALARIAARLGGETDSDEI
jgi:hypothetical protein